MLLYILGGELLHLLNKVEGVEEGKTVIRETLHNNSARQVFCNMLIAQGVQQNIAEKLCHPESNPYEILPRAEQKQDILAVKDGIIKAIHSLVVAEVCASLGAGRSRPEESVDHGVGLVFDVQVGQYIRKGSRWVTVYHKGNFTAHQESQLQGAIEIEASGSAVGIPLKSRIIRVVNKARHPSIFSCQ